MLRFLPYVIKNLWGHRLRAGLTVSGAAVALFVFCFVGAVQEGFARLKQDQQAERSLIVFQANRFCPFTSKLPEDYGRSIAGVPGVADVTPIKVYMNNCRASLDVVVFNGMPPEKVGRFREMHLIDGDLNQFEQRQDGALAGRALANRRGLKVGQRFSIGQVTVHIAGIFTAAIPEEENFLYTHLDFLQRTNGLNSVGTVTQFEVKLTDSADANAVGRAIDEAFHGGPVATDTRPKGVFQANAVGDLAELIGFAHYLGYACVGLVLALVSTTALMAVQDRVREHALLQTLGFTGFRIFGLVLTENVIVGIGGGVLGVGAALVTLALSRLAVGTEGVTIAFTPSWTVALTGMGAALVVAGIAGVAPAWIAARAEIVKSLRAI
jgi:putative ABC transport system permease protein